MIHVEHKGNFDKTMNFLAKARKFNLKSLDKYGKEGVQALSLATPKDTGLTAASWYYEIVNNGKAVEIHWLNSNIVDYVNIALILQYGHGTRNGGYVEGIDYINPAMRDIFNRMADSAWKELTGR